MDDELIQEEIDRLTDNLQELPPERLENARGLIREAAYLSVKLSTTEKYLDANGWTYTGAQGTVARPEAKLYNTMVTNYHRIVKTLDGMIAKAISDKKTEEPDDGFDEFVASKYDDLVK